MLIASAAVGVISGLIISQVKLHLGISGHKAFMWMTPVILARLMGKCKVGATTGALTASTTCFALGGNIAGGPLGLPIVVIAGVMLDAIIAFIEKHKPPFFVTIPVIGLAAMFANLLLFVKRILLPLGIGDHNVLGLTGWWFRPVSYAVCGLLAGLAAATLATLLMRKEIDRSL